MRGLNGGHVAPYLDQNYGEAIAGAKRAGVWVDPVLTIPIPSPDRDERIASDVSRMKALAEIVQLERAAGAPPGQSRVKRIAERLEVDPFELVDGVPLTIEGVEKKVVAPDEWRAQQGLDPLPDGMGSKERLAEEREQGGDEAGALAKVESAEKSEAPATPPAAAEFVALADKYARGRLAAGVSPAELAAETQAMRALLEASR